MKMTIALAGNPNCGKTTMFNRLTGANQRVGNWPGVTIDHKVGTIRRMDDAELVDLPGIYSLSPYSPEEIVSRDYIINERPDAILNIVDATNIERNLYLTLQLLELNVPMVIGLNMIDALEKLGDSVDVEKLSRELGCPVIPVSALKGTGIDEMLGALEDVAKDTKVRNVIRYDAEIEHTISAAEDVMRGRVPENNLRWYAMKLVEGDERLMTEFSHERELISDDVDRMEDALDDTADACLANARYDRIDDIVSRAVKRAKRDERGTVSDRIDRIVTNRVLGLPIFAAVMALVYGVAIGFDTFGLTDVTGVGTYFTNYLNDYISEVIQPAAMEWCGTYDEVTGAYIANHVGSEMLASLLVDGIIGGAGAVLGFLPQMLVLFLCMTILEDVGYMARVAFIMDRVFRFFGLSGKSFIPALVGTGCGVPGILASRTIESPRDRRITAMTVTFMPCGAKLPVIALLAGAVFGGSGSLALFCYFMGIVCILMSGIILKKFRSLSGEPAPFIMELPPYHIPSWMNVLKGTLDRGWAFVKNAATLITLSCVIVWFLASFDTSLNWLGANATTDDSILARIGEAICWVFIPLGWGDNWELTVGTMTGLLAKENLVGTLGTLLGMEVGEEGEEIWGLLRGMLNRASGLSFLMFNMLCAPCFAAIGALHRELGSWKDTAVAIAYQCVFAYMISMVLYGIAGLVYGIDIGTTAIVLMVTSMAVFAFLLIARQPFRLIDEHMSGRLKA